MALVAMHRVCSRQFGAVRVTQALIEGDLERWNWPWSKDDARTSNTDPKLSLMAHSRVQKECEYSAQLIKSLGQITVNGACSRPGLIWHWNTLGSADALSSRSLFTEVECMLDAQGRMRSWFGMETNKEAEQIMFLEAKKVGPCPRHPPEPRQRSA